MRYFFVEQSAIAGSTATITGPDARHITTVLRYKPGERIGLFDGKGLEFEARIGAISPGKVDVSILRRFPSTAESSVQITVAQAFLKERKMDGLLRQLTELGITRWIPFFAQRSMPRPDKRQLSSRMKRWEKIAKEGLKQCRRGRIPEICDAVSFEDVLTLGQSSDLKIAFWEGEFDPVHGNLPKPDREFKSIFALLGPEGGFSTQEIERARDQGFVTVTLGPRILRAETATIAACVLLQYVYGDMGKPPHSKR